MPSNPTAQETSKSDAKTHPNPVGDVVNKFAAHKAAPGPVIPQNMPEQQGTKEERQAKAKALNQ
ncbi:hypothetical protein GGR51DRAFT_499397 [Nemania sp. FL0031]|nr:hypothetical protein GGR51DRAFT_499397 [Nemania sp. FL0031]